MSGTSSTFSLLDRYTREEGLIYLSGLQALLRLALEQHRLDARAGLTTATMISGYPGSPVGSLDSELLRHAALLKENDVVFIPGLNEELAATAVFGAQLMHALPGPKYDGVLGMWFGKAPGVDRTVDAFRHGQYRGIARNGGIIAVAGDDPAAKSSILPNDSLVAFYDLQMPTVYPADVQDVIDLGLHAFALSRASGLATGLKLVADVADSSGTAEVGAERIRPVLPSVELDGRPFAPAFEPNRAGPANHETERLIAEGRLEVARAYTRQNRLNPVFGAASSARIGLVAAGKTYLDLMEALHLLGIEPSELDRHDIRIMKVGLMFPQDHGALREFSSGLDEVVVLEEKRPLLEASFKDALFASGSAPRLVGKTDEHGARVVSEHGTLTPESIARIVARRLDLLRGTDEFSIRAERLEQVAGARPDLPIMRAGHFCSGCPHSTGLKTPDGMIVGGGIGCHTMAIRMGREEFGEYVGFTQMGGEGAQWVGAAPFTETDHFFQNLGDGTFAHSGSLAIRFAVAAGINVTYKLLYNSAVAMTGGQQAVGGKTAADTVRLLESEGVKRVAITTDTPSAYRHTKLPSLASVHHRDDILDVERELAATPGVTVLLHDQQCAIEKRRDRKRGKQPEPEKSVFINERVCEGCGDCGRKSSCLSVVPVETEFGRKTQIHQSSCTKDYSCLQGDCPSFLTVTPALRPAKRRGPARGWAARAGSRLTDEEDQRLGVVEPGKAARAAAIALPDVEIPTPDPMLPPGEFELHMSGIGGTGVITVNQILGTAAAMSGHHVRVLDQFGGSQKAGGVTSNLKVSRERLQRANAIANKSADALLVYDVLVATEKANLAKADPARTVAIVSTNRVPTGPMIVDPSLDFPKLPLFASAIDRNSRSESNVYVDAQSVAERLLGNHMATNLFLTGAAFQKGVIPLPAIDIEAAIRLNGVAVDMNVDAFRWGRLAVSHPQLVEQALTLASETEPVVQGGDGDAPRRRHDALRMVDWADGELNRLLQTRAGDLIDYQDAAYAERYVEFVRLAAAAERAVSDTTELAAAVARGLYRFMAYKDEYEVARLHLEDAARASVNAAFGPGAKVHWHLHPPVLRSLGMKRKIALGAWFAPAFRALRAMRRLRGTRLDVFGYASVRRTERALIDEYLMTMREVLDKLTVDNLSIAVELAELPDIVRGYEEIKLANVKRYSAKREELLQTLNGSVPRAVTLSVTRAGGRA